MLSLLFQDDAAESATESAGDETPEVVGSSIGDFIAASDFPACLSDTGWWTELGKLIVFDAGPPILAALAIFIIGRIVAKIVVGVVGKIMRARKLDETLVGFVTSLVYMLLMAFIVIAAIGKLGVDTTSFSAIIAAAGLAIGFALQGSLGNFAAGVMLIVFRPFKAGDFVEAGGATGVIEEIQVFATKIRTGDNKSIIVPNGSITGGNIINYSAKDTRRVDMVFGIGYDDDIRQAKQILEDLLKADDRVLEDPAWTIGVSELADSSVNIVCRPWVASGDYWGVFFDMHERVKYEFDAKGISIPYPQSDVHMFQQTESAAG